MACEKCGGDLTSPVKHVNDGSVTWRAYCSVCHATHKSDSASGVFHLFEEEDVEMDGVF